MSSGVNGFVSHCLFKIKRDKGLKGGERYKVCVAAKGLGLGFEPFWSETGMDHV